MTDAPEKTWTCTQCGEYAGTPVHDHIEALQTRIDQQAEQIGKLSNLLDKQLGTPCEAIRHEQEVDASELYLCKASSGSTDAALKFLAAVLPDWEYTITKRGAAIWHTTDYGDPFCAPYSAKADIPATAIILAALQALKEQRDE
jgi:hypothetical protein